MTTTTPGGTPHDWTSLGEAAREALLHTIAGRAFRTLTADIETHALSNVQRAEINLCILMHMAYVLGDTPPDGADPQMWHEAVAESLRKAAMEGVPLPGVNGCILTRDLLIPVLGQFTHAFAVAARGVVAKATVPGVNRNAILASALAAHCSQIAAGVMERARAEEWDADHACAELASLFRTVEAMIRNNMPAPGGTGPIGEVQGHA